LVESPRLSGQRQQPGQGFVPAISLSQGPSLSRSVPAGSNSLTRSWASLPTVAQARGQGNAGGSGGSHRTSGGSHRVPELSEEPLAAA
jgi:hypothetical protein